MCNLENNKTLEFFRVNNMDSIYFPRDTFSTLRIHSGTLRIHSGILRIHSVIRRIHSCILRIHSGIN